MPSIADSLMSNLSLTGFTPESKGPDIGAVGTGVSRNVFCRCPVPQIGITSPDTISQSNLGGVVPQYRLWVKNG